VVGLWLAVSLAIEFDVRGARSVFLGPGEPSLTRLLLSPVWAVPTLAVFVVVLLGFRRMPPGDALFNACWMALCIAGTAADIGRVEGRGVLLSVGIVLLGLGGPTVQKRLNASAMRRDQREDAA
jgi:hypothetical protein